MVVNQKLITENT
ncbi:hypothetical protein FWK35_00038298 [Aphis craccivora]|uniref:Uncharacterized protein n=2 Tax=Aphis craccivora TaxID=307492 RepID=A0A6G0VTZ3_APHCR|nr:hypothetical protein FWK35_00038298 [Aphis craccivora]